MNKHTVIFISAALLVVIGLLVYQNSNSTNDVLRNAPDEIIETTAEPVQEVPKTRRDFAELDTTYRFSGELPHDWVVRYIAATDAIAVFHSEEAAADLNNASIFIRNFTASSFETLSTVNVISSENTTYNAHKAVRYEIEKKADVADFADQPLWRSGRHKLVDIRFEPDGETSFFVFAYKPDLREELYNDFLNSIRFYNDANSMVAPLDRTSERVTKKSFGTQVSPSNSPVMPERFSGYHTGWDFEVFTEEIDADVAIGAICGGPLRQKATSSGYGGYAVQQCEVADEVFTVIYGHLRLSSIAATESYLGPGEQVGLLGNHESSETDGERKHLHLSVHKGSSINIRGYVSSQSDLSGWINPDIYL